jgi:hypothetical protein
VAEASGYAPPPPDDEQPEVNDETLSEVFQQPIKAAGDLSRGRTLLVIFRPRPSPEFQTRGSCSWKSSGVCGALKSTSESGVQSRFSALPAVSFPSSQLHRSLGQW